MFNVEELNASLNDLSQAARWEVASQCPCKSRRTGGADTQCLVCHGNGMTWDAATTCRIALQGMKSVKEFAMLGMWEKGDILVSLPSDSAAYECGEYDRFTLTDSRLRISQVLMRGAVSDALKYTAVISIEKIWGIYANARVDFTRGIDYTLVGNVITWLAPASTPLPVGSQYTVVYVTHPQYYVYRDLVSDRPHGSQDLPRKVHLRLMELFSRTLVATS